MTASMAGCSSSPTSESAIAKVRTCSDYDHAPTDTEAAYLKQMMGNLGTPVTLDTVTQVRNNIQAYCATDPTALLLNLGANYFRGTPLPPTSATASDSDTITPQAGATSFANGQPSTSVATTSGDSFTWSDPNGYQFRISVSFGTPGIADPVAGENTGCAGSDAPPDTTNIPFTLTVTNLLSDRGSSHPALEQGLVNVPPNPHPAGAGTAISETDGDNCGGSLYGLAGFEQNANAVPAGQTVTIQGVIYAAGTPIPDGAAMTFGGLAAGDTPIANIPIPAS